MISLSEVARLQGRPAHDSSDELIGTIDQIYMSDGDTEPRWVTLTRPGESRPLFAPLEGAVVEEDRLRLPLLRELVLTSPAVTADEDLGADDEAQLCRHYGFDSSTGRGKHAADSASTATESATPTATPDAPDAPEEARVTLDGERLIPGTEQVTRQLRIRRYVVTEVQLVEVPLKQERLAIERVPLDGGAPEVVEEFTLRAEKVAFVQTETVAVEDVQISKAVVTEEERLTVEVAREQVEVEVHPSLTSSVDEAP